MPLGQAGLIVAGRNATNGWVRMKPRTAASSRRSPQPRIVLSRRSLPRMLTAELDGDVEGLVIGEEPVLRGKRVACQLHPGRRPGAQVANPVGVWAWL